MPRSRVNFNVNGHFLYTCITKLTTPEHNNTYPWVMKFTILVYPSLVMITGTIYLVYLIYAHTQRRGFLKKFRHFLQFGHALTQEPRPHAGHKIYNSSQPFDVHHYYLLSFLIRVMKFTILVDVDPFGHHHLILIQGNLYNPTCTGRETLCHNRQGVGLQCTTHRKLSKRYENQPHTTQGNALVRCWIRQVLLYMV